MPASDCLFVLFYNIITVRFRLAESEREGELDLAKICTTLSVMWKCRNSCAIKIRRQPPRGGEGGGLKPLETTGTVHNLGVIIERVETTTKQLLALVIRHSPRRLDRTGGRGNRFPVRCSLLFPPTFFFSPNESARFPCGTL